MESKRIGKGKMAFLAFLVIAGIAIIANHKNTRYITDEGNVFGTYYHITYSYHRSLQTEIDRRLAMVDASLSPFNKRSIITAVNENRDVRVDTMFRHVFGIAQSVSEATNGAFDITVAPLVNAWGFGFAKKDSVTPAKIHKLLKTVGYRKVSLSEGGRVIKQNPATKLDCSAIAKGYGCDAVAALFNELGITDYLIEIGGEIVAKGKNAKNSLWSIGINRPVDDSTQVSNQIEAIVELTDCGMATSGNYRRFYYKNGKRYAHTIDPRTGFPVQHTLLSSTVIAGNCATADAYATAFMVLGVDSAKKVLEKHPELEAYLIYSDAKGGNGVWMSPALARRVSNAQSQGR